MVAAVKLKQSSSNAAKEVMEKSDKSYHKTALTESVRMKENGREGNQTLPLPFSEISETGCNCRKILQLKSKLTVITSCDNRVERGQFVRME